MASKFSIAQQPPLALLPLRVRDGRKTAVEAHRNCKLLCFAMLPAPSTGPSPRRSANYQPSLWDYDQLQSVSSCYKIDTQMEVAERLKQIVSLRICQESNLVAQLELISTVQSLGIGYHFSKEINELIGSISIKNATMALRGNIYATSLLFRLRREHGFQTSQDIFDGFIDKTGSFMGSIFDDTLGTLSLYEASNFALEDEEILDEARALTTTYLNKAMANMTPSLRENLTHSLKLPLIRKTTRLHARRFIQNYEKEADMDIVFLQLAKIDFNHVQSLHQEELTRLARWWKIIGVREKLSFARDRLLECFMFAVGVVTESHSEYCRERITKVCTLITTIDDIYDIFGLSDELQLFTRAIDRWKPNLEEDLPEYMKRSYYVLYNTCNEMAREFQMKEGWNALYYLRKGWSDLCKSFLLEAKWHFEGYTPTLDEYLSNGWMSVSGHVLLLHTTILSNDKITEDTMKWLSTYPRIVQSSSMIFRLCNDLATSTAELERGDVATSIQCYMNQYGVSEAAARKGIKDLIEEQWKKLNKDVAECMLHHGSLANTALNLARTAHYTYQNEDGIGAPDQEKKNQVMSMFFEPLPLDQSYN